MAFLALQKVFLTWNVLRLLAEVGVRAPGISPFARKGGVGRIILPTAIIAFDYIHNWSP